MIFLTGGAGFVGGALYKVLDERTLILFGRSRPKNLAVRSFYKGNIDALYQYGALFESVDVIIHCAARVHVMQDESQDPLAAFREINVEGTVNLARQAAEAGVKRFVFLSSIKVNGEWSLDEAAFSDQDKPSPQDPYAVSKFEAEEALKKVCADMGMEYVIIRPPLVYGPGVKANFRAMLKWLSKGVPLPLGAINHNKRSLVCLDNLVDLIQVCIEHPAAANQTFLVSDDDDVSTRELLVRVAAALGVKSRLLNIPPSLLGLAGRLLGKKDIEQRLCASLQVDIAHTKNTLNWTPTYSMEEGLKQTADWYKARS